MIKNKLIDNILQEYDIERDSLYECIAHTCRKMYGIIEVLSINDSEIDTLVLGEDGKLKRKTINITNAAMLKMAKGVIKEIETHIHQDAKVLEIMSYKSVLLMLQKDIEKISKSPVVLRVISTRALNEKEKKKNHNISTFVIVRASRYLNPSEQRYFKTKAENLKKGVAFVLS